MDRINQFFAKHSIRNRDRAFFVHHLSLILKAGISLPKALIILSKQVKNSYFKRVLINVEKKIQKGNTFEEALLKYKGLFSKSMISMVRIGEMKGDLYAVLNGYYQLLNRQDKIRSKVKSAMVYPIVVVVALIAVSVFAVFFIFPRLIELVNEFQGELPLPTRISIAVSGFATEYGLLMIIFFVILLFAAYIFSLSKPGRWVFHALILRVPVVGNIVKHYNIAIMSRNFGTLLNSGIPVTDALYTTSTTLNNVYFKSSVLEAMEMVQKGDNIHQALQNHPSIYPDLVLQIIIVGEQSGSIDEMMLEIADFYEEQLLITLDTLASIIEPIVILILGVGVAFLALSILLPLYSLSVLI